MSTKSFNSKSETQAVDLSSSEWLGWGGVGVGGGMGGGGGGMSESTKQNDTVQIKKFSREHLIATFEAIQKNTTISPPPPPPPLHI